MKTISNLLIKFAMVTVVLEVVLLLLTSLNFFNILWLSLIVTIVAYLIGDNLILPATNNVIATISDMGLVIIVIYIFDYFWTTAEIYFITSLIVAVLIGAGEWFFHKYINREVEE